MEYQITQFKGISDKQHQGVGAEYVSNFALDRDGVLSPVLAMTKETAAGAPVKRVIEGTSTVWGLGDNAGTPRVYNKSAITDAWSGFYTNAAGTLPSTFDPTALTDNDDLGVVIRLDN